jgi:23S rRNA (cytosine1962-C5)-methyltransferase
MVKFTDYELIDFGQGRKLERFGSEVLNRPESMAQNSAKSNPNAWSQSNHIFTETENNKGKWAPETNLDWFCKLQVERKELLLHLHKGKYKHVGVFPEQLKHWRLIEKELNPESKMLNLFAYTGVASLVGAVTGAAITHIDSSGSIMKVAKQNAEINHISNIRFIQEDALKFSERERKRKSLYNLVICDPPVFGMGVKREKWKLEKDLPGLIQVLSQIIIPGGMLILNTYSPRVSIEDMERLVMKNGFAKQDSGWLEIQSSDKRTLRMSKYIVCRRGASA